MINSNIVNVVSHKSAASHRKSSTIVQKLTLCYTVSKIAKHGFGIFFLNSSSAFVLRSKEICYLSIIWHTWNRVYIVLGSKYSLQNANVVRELSSCFLS